MKTLRDLNSTSLESIDFTDDRDAAIIFDRDYPDDQSITEVEGQPIYIPKGTEIVEIINGEDLDLEIEFTYPDDLTDTQYPNKPSYITATAVDDSGTNQSITFSGFKSASDYTWLFENFYVKGSRTFFDTFTIFVEIRCPALSITSQNYNVSVTLTDANLLDAPSSFDYDYASSGFTDYDVVALLDQGNNNDDEYTVELVFSGDYSSNVVNGQTTSSVGLYEWTDSDKTLTLTAQNRDDMNSMLENVQIDFNQTQYDHTVTFVARNQTEVLVDFETQQITSSDDTILSEGVPKTYTTDFVLGAQAPDFNTGLSGSLFTATITPKDNATVTELKLTSSYFLPTNSSSTYTVTSFTQQSSINDHWLHKRMSADGQRVLYVYYDADDSNESKAKIINHTGSAITTERTIIPGDEFYNFIFYDLDGIFMSQDGNTVVYDIVDNTTTYYKRITEKRSGGGTWTKYSTDLDVSGGHYPPEWLNDDGTLLITAQNGSIYQTWNSSTNEWEDDTSNTRLNNFPDDINLLHLSPSLDGSLGLGTGNSVKLYKWTGSAWNTTTYTTQPDGTSNGTGSLRNRWMSDDGNWAVLSWRKTSASDTIQYDLWALNWNGSSWDYYSVIEDIPYTLGNLTPKTGTFSVKINNNGFVFVHMDDDTGSPRSYQLRGYEFRSGVGYQELAYEYALPGRDDQETYWWASAEDDYVMRINYTQSSPYLNTIAWSDPGDVDIVVNTKQIDITTNTVAQMNTAISNIEVDVAGTDNITLIFDAHSADGNTERAYTITYGS